MKRFKKVFAWIILSLIVQSSMYFYIDKYYLTNNTKLKATKVEKKNNDEKPDLEIKLPDNAKNINMSFDGKYAAYYDGDILKVLDTKTNEERDIAFDEGTDLSYYKWLSDRNRMLIAEKHKSENGGYRFKLSYYDVDKDTKEEFKDLTWGDEGSIVEDIQESTITNVMYVKVSRGGGNSRLYWINIMAEMKRVPTKVQMIGDIALIYHEDKLLYESMTYNKIYVTNKEGTIDIEGVEKPKLLGVDIDDNVYIGKKENDKISKVYYGNLETPTNQWRSVPFDQPIEEKDVHITKEGKVLINDNLNGIVKDVATGKETKYKGKFLQIYEGGVSSISENKLIKTKFN
ncbi:hypothetical protein DP149_12785 [Clostridium tetani]|uniref:Conserved protein n=1 Tax=Clostridium tetani (strain Massachusetts / E88) TaxID=212717 RepID=Q897E8_CLOTE|nr:hypothetical protein [Clostridium tetani]AAO35390.1 conserved protein [Clostridium tetani E88]KGI38895.1 hypothetical protein KY52_05240 [Clostridium tetani]KGI40608.1 hypothetical protein LA33_08205 [Clostridium tetani ATCC 9441]KGI43401.1 hypothetical protein KY54_10400 [Clostridium tetani]KHO36506.1 hypothetical protein OR63_03710 [Clostridium tetani]